MRTSTAPHHDDRTRARRRSDARHMRRFELHRLHADTRFARNGRGRPRHDGSPHRLERRDGRLYPQTPAPHARLVRFVQSRTANKARGGLLDLILPEVLRCVTRGDWLRWAIQSPRARREKLYRFNRTTPDQLSRTRPLSGASSNLWSRKAFATVTGKAISALK